MMFRALRELLMSGDIRGLLDGSRRALRDLNASGFGEMALDNAFIRENVMRGDVNRYRWEPTGLAGSAETDWYPYWNDTPAQRYLSDRGVIPRVEMGYNPELYSQRNYVPSAGPVPFGRPARPPIEAPYEGFHVWPYDEAIPSMEPAPYSFAPPQWYGRGTPPSVQSRSLPFGPSYFSPGSEMNVPQAFVQGQPGIPF